MIPMAEVVADGGEVANEQQIPMRWLTRATETPPARPKRCLLAFRPEELVDHRRECQMVREAGQSGIATDPLTTPETPPLA